MRSSSRKTAALDIDDYADAPPAGFQVPGDALSWRQDKNKSMSDWVITVKREDGKPVKDSPFHVHKAMLAAGPRPAEFFADEFAKAGHATELVLKASAADAFPQLLDFVYGGKFTSTTKSATALLYLANSLRIRTLHASAMEYTKTDLGPQTVATYCMEAAAYGLEKLGAASIQLCAEQVLNMAVEELAALPPALFSRVVESGSLRCTGSHLSTVVVAFAAEQPTVIDAELLAKLTPSAKMPVPKADVAIALLELAEQHGDQCLAARCIGAAAGGWEDAVMPLMPKMPKSRKQPVVVKLEAETRGKRHRGAADQDEPAPKTEKQPKKGTAAAPPPPPAVPMAELGVPADVKLRVLGQALQTSHAELLKVRVQYGVAQNSNGELKLQLEQLEQANCRENSSAR